LLVASLLGFGQISGVFMTSEVLAEEASILPPGDKEPLLRLEAGGPTSFVTALAFSPDGKLLYVGGWDKVVRVWSLNEQGKFVPTQVAYRVPIGPGLSGAINCIALSPDGRLLAVAGQGVFREEAGFRVPGLLVPSLGAMDSDMLRDQGTIYVFDTRTQGVRLLRGHAGQVLSLAFAPGGREMPPVLVSGAVEKDEDNKQQSVLRAWNGPSWETLSVNPGLPYKDKGVRPGLAVWRSGSGPKDLQVAFALSDSNLRVWDVAKGVNWKEADGKENVALTRWPEAKQLISGSLAGANGQLQVWKYSPSGGLQLDKQ